MFQKQTQKESKLKKLKVSKKKENEKMERWNISLVVEDARKLRNEVAYC